jgi:hypothetical protein
MTVTFDLDTPDELLEMQDVEGKVAYTAAHAQHVEWDTEYNHLEVSTIFGFIRPWVDRKWNDLSGGLKAAAIEDRQNEPSQSDHKDAVAWMISASIKKTGIEGVFYAQRSIEYGKQKTDAIDSALKDTDDPQAAQKAVSELLNLTFTKSQEIISDEATDQGTLLQSGQLVPPSQGG